MLKEECISIDSMVDIRQFDMEQISDDVVPRLNFGDLEWRREFEGRWQKRSAMAFATSTFGSGL